MANIFLESFDNIASADLILKGYGNTSASFTIGTGRTNNGLIAQAAGVEGYGPISLYKILPASYSSMAFGCAFKTDNPMASRLKIWSFCFDTTEHIYIILTAGGQLQFWLANIDARFDVLLGVSPHVYDFGSFYYFEFKIVFSTTATGSINYRVNGVAQTAITGIITANAGATLPKCNLIFLWTNKAASAGFLYDDMYANDLTGATNNDYMGDVRIFVMRPFGAAGTTWTAVGSGTNLGCVSEATPDGDTTYLSSSTAGQIDLYTLTAPPASLGAVKAVQSNLVARKDDGITRQIAPVLGDGTHANNIGVTVSIGNGYVDYLQCYDINPLTGAAWAVADLSTLRLGVKEIA